MTTQLVTDPNIVIAKQPAPTIREACFSDYAGIASLSRRNGLTVKRFQEWKHLWAENPAYKKLSTWPIGWILQNRSEIVGYIGNIPLTHEYRGRQIIAATSYGLAVDSAYRNHSLSLIGRFYRQSNVSLFLNTTANAQASKVYQLFRANQVPVGVWNRAGFWITDHRGFMASVFVTKKVPMGSVLSVPLGVVMFLKEKIAGRHLKRPLSGPEVNFCRHFDDRFDTFWQELQRENPTRFLATRSREVLDWHFKYALAQEQAWVATIERDSRLIAYAIFCGQDNPTLCLKRVRLVDFQTLGNKPELLVPMLAWAVEKCQTDRIHMLEVIGFGHEKQKLLERLAPYRRELPSWLYFYKTTNDELGQALGNPEAWDPCLFDGDSSL